MPHENYIDILKRLDRELHLAQESSQKEELESYKKRFNEFYESLRSLVKVLSFDDENQDANFFCKISFADNKNVMEKPQLPIRGTVSEEEYLLKVDNFKKDIAIYFEGSAIIVFSEVGNLVTIGQLNRLYPETKNRIIELFNKYGFIYIPIEQTADLIPGRNESWYHRFFDYD